MGKPVSATGTSKDQNFTTNPPIPGDWVFTLDGPDKRTRAVSDLANPVVFPDVQPGTYTVKLKRMAANGVDMIGDEVSSQPVNVTADVIIAVAAGVTAQIISQTT